MDREDIRVERSARGAPSALARRLTSLPWARLYVWMSVNWPVVDRFA
jgi:hypothetical protein